VTVTSTDLVHLGRSDLGVSPPSDDLRGMVVVDPSGLRIGEVDDVLIEVRDRSARLISVVSGGVFGVAVRRTLIPVETITSVDDRVHLDRSYAEVGASSRGDGPESGDAAPASVAEAYEHFGVVPRRQATGTGLLRG